MVSAVGIDRERNKHILGIELGAAETAASVKTLLTRLRDQGMPTGVRYLFVIDEAEALRRALKRSSAPISRCSAAATTRCAT